MSYGSYYQGDYYRNPTPYTSSDIGAPVPGWGVNPRVAGPARVGVGALTLSKAALLSPTVQQAAAAQPSLFDPIAKPQGRPAPSTFESRILPAESVDASYYTETGAGTEASGVPTYVWALLGVAVVGGAIWMSKKKS